MATVIMPGSAVTLSAVVGRRLAIVLGWPRVRGACGARSGPLDLPLAPAPWAREADEARRRRERGLRERRRRRPQADVVRLGFAHAPDPGLEHEAVHDGGAARPLRGRRRRSRPGSIRVRPERSRGTRSTGAWWWSVPATPRWASGASLAATASRRPRWARLASQVRRAGIKRVTGKVLADDSIFDRRRGIPTSGVDASGELGPLSGLSYDSGHRPRPLREEPGARRRPGAEAQARAARGPRRRGDRPRQPSGAGAPQGAAWERELAHCRHASRRHAQALEQLLRRDAAEAPRGSRAGAKGTTQRGRRKARRFAHRVGARVSMENGSGLSRADRASPREVARLLIAMDHRPDGAVFRRSLPLAGEQGTVAGRMNGTAADGDCRTKTGTLIGVSALSGYCDAGHGARRLLDPYELGERGRGAPRPGSDGGADRPLQTLEASTTCRHVTAPNPPET